jgi:hypothetical protein
MRFMNGLLVSDSGDENCEGMQSDASVIRVIARVNNIFVERRVPQKPSSRRFCGRVERPEQIRRVCAQKWYNDLLFPGFPEPRRSGDIISLTGEVAMITTGNAVLFLASDETV